MELIKYVVNRFITNHEQNENDVKNMIDHINSRLVKIRTTKDQLTNKIKDYNTKIENLKIDIARLYKLYKKPSPGRDQYKIFAVIKLNDLHQVQKLLNIHVQFICFCTTIESELESAISIKGLTDIINECNDGIKDTRQIINEETIANTLAKLTKQIDKLDIESMTSSITNTTSDLSNNFGKINEIAQLDNNNILDELEEISKDFDDIDLPDSTNEPSSSKIPIDDPLIQQLKTINAPNTNTQPPVNKQSQPQPLSYPSFTFITGAGFVKK